MSAPIKSKTELKRLIIQMPDICGPCGIKLGGKLPDYPITMSGGVCGRCKKDTGIVPWSDFSWPKLNIARSWD